MQNGGSPSLTGVSLVSIPLSSENPAAPSLPPPNETEAEKKERLKAERAIAVKIEEEKRRLEEERLLETEGETIDLEVMKKIPKGGWGRAYVEVSEQYYEDTLASCRTRDEQKTVSMTLN